MAMIIVTHCIACGATISTEETTLPGNGIAGMFRVCGECAENPIAAFFNIANDTEDTEDTED